MEKTCNFPCPQYFRSAPFCNLLKFFNLIVFLFLISYPLNYDNDTNFQDFVSIGILPLCHYGSNDLALEGRAR